MRKCLLLIFTLAWTPAYAQVEQGKDRGELHRFELAVNPYSFAQLDGFNLHGAGAALAAHVANSVAIVADFSLHKTAGDNAQITGLTGISATADEEHFAFRFGPRFTSRKGRTSIFGQVLIGGMHLRHTSEVRVAGVTVKNRETEHGWAGLAGGGIDVGINHWFSFRVIEANYAPIYLDGFVIHGPRISAGIVFHLQ
jgi:hypothetical protein